MRVLENIKRILKEHKKELQNAFRIKEIGILVLYIPWREMVGMRDKLILEYFGIDMEILWKAINDEIPPLKPLIKNILKDLAA